MDEDEVLEITSFGGTEVRELQVGLDHAEARNRSRFVSGEIEAEEFEAEVGRLLAKRR